MRQIDLIIVHCSATRPSLDVRAVDLDRWHRARGWRGLGYHYVITRGGLVEPGRPEFQIGAHTQGFNSRSIGVCLVGGVAEDGRTVEANYTTAQYQALHALLGDLRARYPQTRICGHRDLSPDLDGDGEVERHEWVKGCPSFDVATWCVEFGIESGGRQ